MSEVRDLSIAVLGGLFCLIMLSLIARLLPRSLARGRLASEETMRLLFDASPVPICLVDSESLRFLAVNDAAVRDYGFSRRRFLDMTVYDLLAPEEHAELRNVAASVETEPGYRGMHPWRHICADGTQVLVQAFVQPIPYKGRRAHFVTLFDVTARENAAKAMALATDAAEAANRAKGDFLANMSHEIRTPLNGVLGMVGALQRTSLDAKQLEIAQVIESSASTLQRVLSDVLEMSRIGAGELRLQKQLFDLPSLLEEVGEPYASEARRKGVAYKLIVEREARTWVEADRGRLGQVLGALLSNAVKFTSAGEISLYVGHAEPDRFRFVVSDSGVGFGDEFRSRLFERFEQADASITRRFGGSGLGLAIAFDLVKGMGGELRADSRPGFGSTFVLDLRLSRCAPPQAIPALNAASARREPGSTTLRVLMADGHAINRRVVELILGASDVDLTAVEDGLQAVQTYHSQRFDLVLMDRQMPVMDGLEAIRRIRADEAARAIPCVPIVVLSADPTPENVEAARAAGATGSLTKPIQARALLQTIKSVQDVARLRGAA